MEWDGIPNTEEKLYKRFINGSNFNFGFIKIILLVGKAKYECYL